MTIALIVLIALKKLFYRAPMIVSAAIWFDMMLIVNLYINLLTERTANDDLPAVFYLTFVVYTMLPLSKMWTLGLCTVTMVTQLVLAGCLANVQDQNFGLQVILILWFI